MTHGKHVTASECARLRQRKRNGNSYQDLSAPSDFGRLSIKHHVRGKCSHDLDVDPISREEALQTVRVGPEECKKMRKLHWQNDWNLTEISNEVDWSISTVASHVDGECSHGDEFCEAEP